MDILNLCALIANPEITEVVGQARRLLQSVLPDGSFSCREQFALMLTNEVVRSLLEEELQSLADEFGERVAVQGVIYQKHEPGAGKYHSLCGTLNVIRCTYRQVGLRNGPTVVPVELAAGIAERATPAMAYSVAHGYAQQDSRAYHESLEIAHRVPPSRATLERMASALAEAAVEQAGGVQSQLRRVEKVPEGACAVVMGLDRTSVPMAEPRPADAPAKPAPVRRKPLVRRPPEPFDINWRMAYVGTVCIVDQHGEALITRRYAVPASDDPAVLVEQMTEDVRAAVRRDATLHVGIVQDGAPEMWNLARAGVMLLREDGDIAHWNEGIDRYHLMERLAKALDIIGLDANRRQYQLDAWKKRFDADDSTIEDIQSYLTKCYAGLPVSKQEQLWEHLAYVQNNNDRMRYKTLRDRGLPVGSGVTESAAKTVMLAGSVQKTVANGGASQDYAASSPYALCTKANGCPHSGPASHAGTRPTSGKPRDPHPRTVSSIGNPRPCGKASCQKERRQETQRRYRERHPEDATARRLRAQLAAAKAGGPAPIPRGPPASLERFPWQELRDEIPSGPRNGVLLGLTDRLNLMDQWRGRDFQLFQ